MARPSKSVAVLASEKKSHRTKAELAQRTDAEKAALSGVLLRESAETAENETAHKEFVRVSALLAAVGKADALYESVINDYCAYKANIARYAAMRQDVEKDLLDLAKAEMGADARYACKLKMRREILALDKQIQVFMDKRFLIEKENGFTLASAMRAIPKKPEKAENPLMAALHGND